MNAEIERRLNECLDARRDPLDDDALVDALADDDAALHAVLSLRADLALLRSPAPHRVAPRFAAAAAALVLAAFALHRGVSRVTPPPAPGARVIEFRCEVRVIDLATGAVQVHARDGRTERRELHRPDFACAVETPLPTNPAMIRSIP